jgi:hypothetical protein
VDVGGAAVHRVEQDLLHVLHDRRVVDVLGDDVGLRLAVGDLDAREIDVLGGLLERLARGVRELLHDHRELVVLDDHRLHGHAGGEFHLLQDLLVGRVRHRHEDAVAALAERDHAVVRDDLVVDQRERKVVDVDGIEVEQRITEGLRSEERHFLGGELFRRDELLDERDAGLGRLGVEGVGIGLDQAALLDQGAPQGAELIGLCGHKKISLNQHHNAPFEFYL